MSIASKDMSEIVYRIKATNVGNYVVPPAYGEAMYDRSVMGRSAAGKLAVSRPWHESNACANRAALPSSP